MAADPKYANLPGIDLEQPDCYETSDLPEDDQAQASEDLNSDSVDILNVSAGEAFTRFKGKSVDSTSADFSDRIKRNRMGGYDVPRTEYEILGDGSQVTETPEQKYQRLQHEIRQLADQLSQVKENVKADADTQKLSPVAMAKQVEYLQHQLTDLHIDKLLGTQGGLDLADPQGALHKRLLTEIEAYKGPKEEKSPEPAKAPTAAAGDSMTYQLYYRPEQAKFSNNAKMADLEQRLERLEAVIGQNPEKLSMLTSETSNKSLIGAVACLNSKLTLLDPNQLDQVEGRLLALNQKLNQVTEKKEQVEDAEKQNKIAELYSLVKKWDTMADTLPMVVDRLAALKDLHEQALQFSQALSHLDTAQQVVQVHLESHKDLLKEAKETMTANMDTLKTNCDKLDQRMKALGK